MTEIINNIQQSGLNSFTPIDTQIVLPIPTVSVPDIIDALKFKYCFLDNKILKNKKKIELFDSGVKYINETFKEFDKLSKISAGLILSKLLIYNILNTENLQSEIDKYMGYLNTNYNTFVSGFVNRYNKTEKLIKFSNNYLLENNYGKEVQEIQQDYKDIQAT